MAIRRMIIFYFLFIIIVIIAGCSQNKTQIVSLGTGGGIKGKVGMPLSDTYIYVYTDENKIHGPWFSISEASSQDGDFRIDNLPPGKYYIVARKRQNGEKGGALTKGDYKSNLYGPIEIKEGVDTNLNISCYVKMDSSIITNLANKKTNTGLSGIITDGDGKPIAGIRVHVYTYIQMSERPKYVSDKTGPDGRYTIYLPESGTFYICARDRFGGPPAIGELYGRFDGGDINPTAIVVKENEMVENINMTVHKVW